MKRSHLILGGLAALLLIGTTLSRRHDDALQTTHPTSGKAVQAVYATGTVEASVMIPLAPRITARLSGLLADEDMHVEKGQILAQLEDLDSQASLAELKAKETLASQELKRTERLLSSHSISRAEADQTRANYEAAKAAHARAKAEASFLQIIAPEDGTIIKRDGEIGQLLKSGEPVFWMSCCSGLRISTEVDEEDIPLVQVGQHVLIRADAFGEQIFKGRVASITPKGDPVARSYRVRVVFDQETPLQIGMTAETNIVIREAEQALLIPNSAIRSGKVWLIENDRIKIQPVKTGARTPTQTEILEGITSESTLLLKPTDALKDGDSPRTRPAG